MAGQQSRTARPAASAAPPTPAVMEAEEIPVPTMSPSMRQFAPAFVRVQLALRPVVKNANNPHFQNNFADLAAILEEALPLLNNNGFSLMQFPATLGNQLALLSILMHESGEFISATMPLLLQKADPQGEGSAITYGRRYAACAILGIRTADDDGNAASERQPATRPAEPARRPARAEPSPPDPGDAPQPKEGWATIEAEAAAHKAAAEQIKQLYAVVGEDHQIRKTLTGYRELNGWPMPANALMQLSMIVAKAHGEATAAATEAKAGETPSAADPPAEAPAPAPEAPRAGSGPSGEEMPWDNMPTLGGVVTCPWCEKAIGNQPAVITGGTSPDDPVVKYHKGCYEERQAEAETPAEEQG